MYNLNKPRGSVQGLNYFRAMAVLVFAPLATCELSGQSLYWDGNGATTGAGASPAGGWDSSLFWSTDANGELAPGAWVPGANAFFSAGTDALGPFAVTLDGPQSVGQLHFEEGAVTLVGATPATNLTIGGTIEVNSGLTAALNVLLSGTGGLTKTGAGTLVLGNANDYSGNTVVNGGVLSFSTDQGLGAVPGAVVQDNVQVNDATLRFTGGVVTFAVNRGVSFGGSGGTIDVPVASGSILLFDGINNAVISGGTFTKTGPGEIRVFRATNTFTKLVIDNGTFAAGQSTFAGFDECYGAIPGTLVPDAIVMQNGGTNRSLGSGTVNISANRGITLGPGGGVFRSDVQAFLIDAPITGVGGLRKEGNRNVTLNGALSYQGPTVLNGASGSTVAAITLNGRGTATGPLIISNATLTLNHENAFSSVTFVAGRINANTNGCLGTGPITISPTNGVILVNATTLVPTNVILNNDIILNPGTTLTGGALTIDIASNQGREMTLNGKISGTAHWKKDTAGSLGALILANENSDFSGSVTNFTGTLMAAANNALGSVAGNTVINSGSSLAFRGGVNYSTPEPVTISGNGRLSNGAISNDSGNCTFAGPITLAADSSMGGAPGTTLTLTGTIGESGGARVLTKSTAGSLRLTADNQYSGGTLVNAGTLIVANTTGSATGPGPVTVAAGASLQGPGNIAGALTIAGTIAPGASPGTLNSGSETWNGGGSYTWEINDATGSLGADPGWDLIQINGTLTVAATSADKFSIDLRTLTLANAPGLAANFDAALDHTWTIVKTTGGITGFDPAAFNIVTSNFQNPVGTGIFLVELANGGNDLVVRIVHPAAVAVQPVNAMAECGTGSATFTVGGTGTAPLTYQWRLGGTAIPGATADTLTINPTTSAAAGSYDVVVTNPYGTATSAAATLTLADTVAPQITTCPANQTISADTTCQAAIPNLVPGVVATDACGPLTITQSPVAGTLVGLGNHTVTITVKDGADLMATCTSQVTVNDSTPPVIATCAPNQTITATLADCKASLPDLTGAVSATDTCPGAVVVTQSPIAGTLVGVGPTLVTLTATDAAGNMATCQATVTVNLGITASVNSPTTCPGGTVTLTATTDAASPTYLWTPGNATTASINVSPSVTTVYSVTVTDGTTGCAVGASGTVTIGSGLTVTVNSESICPGDTATLTATTDAVNPTYLWTPGGFTTASIQVSPSSTTIYSVHVMDAAGCAGDGTGSVTVREPQVFANTGAIGIIDGSPAVPYPSSISVSGLTATVCRVSVTVSNLGHAFPDDIDMVLVAPGGQTVLLMSDVGGANAATGITLTFDDAAAASLPDSTALASGTYKPTNIGDKSDGRPDIFPAPVPIERFVTNFAGLANTDPNGVWSLFIIDDELVDAGQIVNGWSLAITTLTPFADIAVTQAPVPNPVGVGSNLTFMVTVTNRGPAGAHLVTLTDAVTGGFTFVSAVASQGSCTEASGTVSCSLGTIDAGAAATVAINVTPTGLGTIGSAATVAASTQDLTAGNNSASTSATVLQPPVIQTQPLAQVVCEGGTLMFSVAATGDGTLTYQWYKDAGAIAGATAATYVVNNATPLHTGLYSVEVQNAVGGIHSAAVAGTVNPTPTLTVPGATICVGDSATLTATTSAANPAYLWTPGGATTASIIVNPTATTVYTVSVTDGVTGCSNTVSATVTVNPLTVASALQSFTDVCPGTSVTFSTTATGTPPLTYVWRHNETALPETGASLTIAAVVAADAGTYTVEVTGGCSSVTNTGTLTVVAPPVIATQPQNQSTPMGNGAVFSVNATGVSPTYQWQTNGVDVPGATATSLAISNLTLADSGTLVRVLVSNCAGTVTSVAAVLTVTPISGIAFDFNTPGQFTNTPYALIYNDWLNTALPTITWESATGGVGVATGGGGLDLINGNNAGQSSLIQPLSYDFSLPGKTLSISAMVKIKTPANNSRNTQIGFTTLATGDLDNSAGRSYISLILQSTAQPALNYDVRYGSKPNGANTFIEGGGVAGTLTVGRWYKLTATFSNTAAVIPGTYQISGKLEDMGLDGLAAPTPAITFNTVTLTNVDVTGSRNLFAVLRGVENAGVDFWDNVYVYSQPGPVAFVSQPASQTIVQGQRATLQALVDGEGPYTYQWSRNGVPIPGARSWKYITAPVTLSDSGAQYSVEVTGPANSVVSSAATLTVVAEALAVVSAGSVEGSVVGVRFSQPVDPVSAANPANYSINGVTAAAAQLYNSPTQVGPAGGEGARVLVTPASPISGAFTITVQNVKDLSGGLIGPNNSTNGQVEGLTGLDVNPLAAQPVGQNYSFAPGAFEITGGGADIFGAADTFRYLYTQKTGDFDVRVKVPFLDVVRTPTKGGLEVRRTLDGFSPQILAAVNPKPPGRNFAEGTVRQTYNVATTSWGNNTVHAAGYPNVWLRLRRVGNTFLRYSSPNGNTWTYDGQIVPSPAMPETVYFGLAVCAVAQANYATAQFENYGDFAGYPGATIAITQQPPSTNINAGSSASLQAIATVSGGGIPSTPGELVFQWQRSNGAGGWTNVPTAVATNGVLLTGVLYASDNGAEYRVIVSAPGAAPVTSSVATVTVNDATAPTLTAASIPLGTANQVLLTFSEPLNSTATIAGNYVVTNGAGTSMEVVSAVFLGSDPRIVVLTTSTTMSGGTYGVSVSGVQDLNGNAIATPAVRTFTSIGGNSAVATGPVVMEFYGSLTNAGNITDLISPARTKFGTPDFVVYSNVFGLHPNNANFPNQGWGDHYGVRMYSYFVPPTTAAYRFSIRADDFAQFLMNTNATDSTNPAGAVVQINLTANIQAYNAANRVTNNLTAGQRYYMEFRFKESTGGDGGTVAVRTDDTTPTQAEVIPASQLAFPTEVAPASPIAIELYTGLVQSGNAGNGNLPDFLVATNLPRVISTIPNIAGYSRYFGFNTNLVQINTTIDNYFGRAVSYFTPATSGQYKFYLRSDDSSELWMNTNAVNSTDPAGASFMGQIPAFINAHQLMRQGVALTAGQLYYIEARWREGGGGDGFTLAVRGQSDNAVPPVTEVAPGSLFRFPTNHSRVGPARIRGVAPFNPTVTDGSEVKFNAVGISGAYTALGLNNVGTGIPAFISWFKNGTQIFANGEVFTNVFTVADNGAVITCVVSNQFGVASASSTVTVVGDTTAPTLLTAVGSQYYDTVVLTFSEPLDTVTAGCLANYRINGLSVLSATFDYGRRTRVSLRTTPQTPGADYTVTVNGVKDASSSGNLIAADSTATFTGWAPGGGSALLVEIFTNILGTAVDNLVKDSKYINNFPDVSYYTNRFGVGQFAVSTGRDNYGARVSGFFLPPATGFYRFWIRGDDGTQLFMNTNGPSANGRVMIARNDGANSGTYENGTGNGIVGASISPILSLNSNTAYYIEGFVKEGGGGDHMEVVFRQLDPGTLTPIVPLPTPGSGDIALAEFFSAPGDPTASTLTLTTMLPSDVNAIANDIVNLTVVAAVTPADLSTLVRYQWQRFNTATSSYVDVPGNNRAQYSFKATPADDGAVIRVIVSVPGATAMSSTTLHIGADNLGPRIVSAVSLDGRTIGVEFSEPVDAFSAGDEFAYIINGGAALAVAADARPDGVTAVVTLESPITGEFTIEAPNVYGVSDPLGTLPGTGSFTARVKGFAVLDVGAPAAAGSSFSVRDGEIEVVAGGSDIWGNADQGHLTLAPRNGDFDVRVRVHSLLRTSTDTITKAGLMIRETLDANSRTLHYLINPPIREGGRDQGEGGARMAVGGTTAAWTYNTNATIALGTEPDIPNGWIRLTRNGDTFRAYRSRDGMNWYAASTTHNTFSNTVYVGLATTAHNAAAPPTVAQYRNVYIPDPPTITTQPSPASQTLALHGSISYSVVATNPPNSGALRYRWRRNGVAIEGATSATLNIPDAGAGDSGVYTVDVGNDGGEVTSIPVTLTVNNQLPLVNNDSTTAPASGPLAIPAANLLANDSDPEGEPLTITAVSGIAPLTVMANFNEGNLAGATTYGAAIVDPLTGGVDGSGALKLTTAAGNQSGGWVTAELAPRKRVSGFMATFDLRVSEGGANEAADGFSFNFGRDVALGTVGAAEEGSGTGVSFCVDNFRAALDGRAFSSALKLKFGGVQIGYVQTATWNIGRYVPVAVSMTPEGKVTVLVDGTNVFGNVMVPYVPAIGRFGLYARTGGSFESHSVDNVSLTVLTVDTGRDYDLGGAALYGNAYVDGTTGVGGSGALHLTDNANNQAGSIVLPELTPGVAVASFNASFKLRIGNGSANAADGFSFNLASDLPNAATGATAAEEGLGTGLSVCVDNYPTGGADSPSFKLKWGGTQLGFILIPKWNNVNYIPVSLNLDADGTLDVMVDGTNVVLNLPTPYTPVMGRFGLFARTGGENQTHWIDDLVINVTTPGSPANFANSFDGGGPGAVTMTGGTITYLRPINACGLDRFYYLASDGQAGGISVGEVVVTLPETDPQAPIIVTCATNRTISSATPFVLPDLTGEVVAVDNCAVVVTQSPAPGAVLPFGATVVTFTATDLLGLTATCQATITVINTTPPVISVFGFVGGNFSGAFMTSAGVNYRVEYKNTLDDPIWTILTTIVGDGTTKTFTDPGPVVATRFYRITAE